MLLQGFYVYGCVHNACIWVHNWWEFALYLWICAVFHYFLELLLRLTYFYSFLWWVHSHFLEIFISLFIVIIIDEIILIYYFLSQDFFQFRPIMVKTLNIQIPIEFFLIYGSGNSSGRMWTSWFIDKWYLYYVQ